MKDKQPLLVCVAVVLFVFFGMSHAPNGVVGNTSLSAAATPTYSTNFPLVENPLSEGGMWHHLDPTLTVVRVDSINGVNVAHGTQTSPAGTYDDSNAYLQGFGPNQSVSATIWKQAGISGNYREAEILLHWSDNGPMRSTAYGKTQADGYEINVAWDGAYLQIGRFKGANLYNQALRATPQTGDVFGASIVNNANGSVTITVTWNGVTKATITDNANPVLTGQPGIGFFADGQPNNQFGFTKVTATSTDTGAPAAPTNLHIID